MRGRLPGAEVRRDIAGGVVSVRDFLLETAEADALEFGGQLRANLAWRPRLGKQDLVEEVCSRCGERRRAGQEFVQDDAEAPDVSPAVDAVRLSTNLLRRHVARR